MQTNEENDQLFLQKEQILSQSGQESAQRVTQGVAQGDGSPVLNNPGGATVLPGTAENNQQVTSQQPETIPANTTPGETAQPATPAVPSTPTDAQSTAQPTQSVQPEAPPAAPTAPPSPAAGQPAAQPATNPETTPATPAVPDPAASERAPAAQTMQSMSSTVANLLSSIPQFSGTPPSALQRFSEMLLRVAGESTETASDKDSLTAQLEKLFTRISREDSDAGARLRDARQEMFTRLALVEEAISRASQPARAEMLVQTQKLMDHVRLLNSIEQFVYMQLPVQLSEERKTADLYVFKRKGGKRADPDNVNILLAIDLEFMGHWESLVNIKNKDVSIQMEVRGEAEKDHFNSSTVLLHNMLDEAGFKLVSTNIKLTEEETTPLTALSAFDRYTGGKQGIIDFRI